MAMVFWYGVVFTGAGKEAGRHTAHTKQGSWPLMMSSHLAQAGMVDP